MFQALTDEQWAVLAPLLPPPARTGRPRADARQPLNGSIDVLATGCRGQDIPPRYGSSKTCWHRLRRWQQEGVWDRLWQALLDTLDQRQRLDWEHTVLDRSTVPAKTGGAQ
jgi:transposase